MGETRRVLAAISAAERPIDYMGKLRRDLAKSQADNAAYQERLKSILVGICPVPDPECSVAEECDISGTCQAMHALLAADHPGASLLADARALYRVAEKLRQCVVEVADERCGRRCSECDTVGEREICEPLLESAEVLYRFYKRGWDAEVRE